MEALKSGASRVTESQVPEDRVQFDASRHVRLVPPLQDKDLDSYFLTFEHTASTLGWPSDKWSILLSTALKGKAQVAYASIDPVDRISYEKVKVAILKAYELVPEAYRQKFRKLRKADNDTYVEYVRDQERLFDRWCKSRKVDTKEGLKNLVLLEDFKDNLPKEVRSHLDDLDIDDVKVAARRADDYVVTHKLSENTSSSGYGGKKAGYFKAKGKKPFNGQNGQVNQGPKGSTQSQGQGQGQSSGQGANKQWCDHHGWWNHTSENCKFLFLSQHRKVVIHIRTKIMQFSLANLKVPKVTQRTQSCP